MKSNKPIVYSGAWILYVLFSWTLFSPLNVTVFLSSIPLAMLGGWLYLYRGALITTLSTIPYHFLVLWFLSEDRAQLIETVNIFGITTQLVFSFWTAFVKVNREKLLHIKATFEKEIEDRTQDLKLLADHLMEVGEDERKRTTESLLEGPQQSLSGMLRISGLLTQHLKETNHPGHAKAVTIENTIRSTIEHMGALNRSTALASASSNFEQTITELASHLSAISGSNIRLYDYDGWKKLGRDKNIHLYHIIHEALTNALRHAEADNIIIGAFEKHDSVTVYIQNDGKPMPSKIKEGMGLPLLRYRASRIGARLSIDAGPDNETIIHCHIPRHRLAEQY